MLKEGAKIENFTLKDQNGKSVNLKDFKEQYLILYFYPKDNTPGCTKEACAFRDEQAAYKDIDAAVIGISADTEESHKKFVEKFNLPFTLLSDPQKSVIGLFGAWGEKSMYGKTYEGIIRSTFILDKKRQVIKVFAKVKPEVHAAEILEYLKKA